MSLWRAVTNGEGASRALILGERALGALGSCSQTPEHHGEGDVAAHTSMVLDEVENFLSTSDHGEASSTILRLGGLLHDLGKPATTRSTSEGRYTAKGHAEEGAKDVNLLFDTVPYLSGLPLGVGVGVHTLVRDHMWIHHPDQVSEGAMVRMSHLVDPTLLVGLWQSDTRGRVCTDAQSLADKVEYGRLLLEETGCLTPGSLGRLDGVRDAWAQVEPRVRRETLRSIVTGDVRDEGALLAMLESSSRSAGTGGTLTYTIGLPGVGKSTWARAWEQRTGGVHLSMEGQRRKDRRLARINALDSIPRLLGEGKDVLVDATHVRRQSRDLLLGVAGRYHAPVSAVYLNGGLPLALARQETRPWADAVPRDAITKMRRELRFPSPDEYDDLLVVEPTGEEWYYTPETRYLDQHQRRTLAQEETS